MTITVKLFATLRVYNDKEFFLDVKEGITISELVNQLEIPEEEVTIMMVNGRSKEMPHELHAEDVVALFPAVGGG